MNETWAALIVKLELNQKLLDDLPVYGENNEVLQHLRQPG
ncbi:MAG: hypothetical protein AWU57_4417 [Marinobacter sp. T13-3]|jgi:hypothetical protein|nr:MAG: hypothetical protein AWU57_4417 [Marinobacter sp. T13-3]